MTKRQLIIVTVLGIADILVLAGLGLAVSITMQAQEQARIAAQITPTPSPTPTPGIMPTWTPAPTPTPYVQPTSTPRPPSTEESQVLDQIERQVSDLRELSWLRPVSRGVLTENQISRRCLNVYTDQISEDTAGRFSRVMVAFDMIEPYIDLLSLWRRGFCDVAGYYDAEEEAIYVITNGSLLAAYERYIYVEEFTHALQDRHFDLQSLGLDVADGSPEYADSLWAITALIEGEADLVQELYVDEYFSVADTQELDDTSAGVGYTSFSSMPRAVREALLFPYSYGYEFVSSLYDDGGWPAVNAAYSNPPSSSAQILHPELYLDGVNPIAVTMPDLPDLFQDWAQVYSGPAGEFFLRLYLGNHLESTDSAAAAEGWVGDLCQVYFEPDTRQTAMALHTVWDSTREADEFLDYYFAYAEARFGYPADASSGDTACWYGTDTLCVTWAGNQATIMLGPNPSLVEGMLQVTQDSLY